MSDFLRRKLRERQAGDSDQSVDIFRRRMDQAVREGRERREQHEQRSAARARRYWEQAQGTDTDNEVNNEGA